MKASRTTRHHSLKTKVRVASSRNLKTLPSCSSLLRTNSAREMHLVSVKISRQRPKKRSKTIITTRSLLLQMSLTATSLHSKPSSQRITSKLTTTNSNLKRDNQIGTIMLTRTKITIVLRRISHPLATMHSQPSHKMWTKSNNLLHQPSRHLIRHCPHSNLNQYHLYQHSERWTPCHLHQHLWPVLLLLANLNSNSRIITLKILVWTLHQLLSEGFLAIMPRRIRTLVVILLQLLLSSKMLVRFNRINKYNKPNRHNSLINRLLFPFSLNLNPSMCMLRHLLLSLAVLL